MAIQIVQNLSASPNPTTLPKRIDLAQTLVSNLDQEAIRITYRLDPAHDVWFKDGDNPPSKTFDRTETVGRQNQECHDRVTLASGPGSGPMDVVQIDQTIVDAGGLETTDLVLVQLER